MHKTAKFLVIQCVTLKLSPMKFLGVQCVTLKLHSHVRVKWLYYSIFVLFLGVHIKGTQKYHISQCEIENQQEPLSDADTTSSTDLELVCFRQFMMLLTIFSAICIYINCTIFKTANLFFKTKKTTSHQTYKGYSGRYCII